MYPLNTPEQKAPILNQELLQTPFKADESSPAYEPWARSFCSDQGNITGLHQFRMINLQKPTNNYILEREFMSV